MCFNPIYLNGKYVRCGKCLDCQTSLAKEWALRLCEETKSHKDYFMLTLTYNDGNLPSDGNVSKRDVQLFLKRFRKSIKHEVRYFACGEYGDDYSRPHYHLIIWGWYPPDTYFFKTDNAGNPIYRSPIIEECWKKGFSSVIAFRNDLALYVSLYLQSCPVEGQMKPFRLMSRNPGIGTFTVNEKNIASDKLYYSHKGKVRFGRVPRTVLNHAEKKGIDLDVLKEKRLYGSTPVYHTLYHYDDKGRFINKFVGYMTEEQYFSKIKSKRDKVERAFGIKLDEKGRLNQRILKHRKKNKNSF